MAEKSPVEPIHVHFVLLPDSLILDWAGPAEALRMANQALQLRGEGPAFILHFVSPAAQTRSSVGACISGLITLPDTGVLAQGSHWIVLVGQAGASIELDSPGARVVLHWLRALRLQTGRLELVCICSGAIIAARAGLLAQHRVTTHHQHLDELRNTEPACDVVQNRVFVIDTPVCTSAGVTTGLDLMLYRIGQTCGPVLAAQVAQTMVLPLRRGPHDPELSPFLQHRNHLHPAVHRVQDAVGEQPRKDWTLPRMAQIAFVTPRHLGRLFAEHAHTTPQNYVRNIRLALSEHALKMGKNVQQAADIAGFHSDTQLRRAWHAAGKIGTPSACASQSLKL